MFEEVSKLTSREVFTMTREIILTDVIYNNILVGDGNST